MLFQPDDDRRPNSLTIALSRSSWPLDCVSSDSDSVVDSGDNSLDPAPTTTLRSFSICRSGVSRRRTLLNRSDELFLLLLWELISE